MAACRFIFERLHVGTKPPNSLDKAGVKLSFGSDYPSTGAGNLGVSPLYNIEIGHTRQYPGRPEAPIQPPTEERLTIPHGFHCGYTAL
jgi:predicted amidohydrolase YtcJ